MARKLVKTSGQGFGVFGTTYSSWPFTYSVCAWVNQESAGNGCIFSMNQPFSNQQSRARLIPPGLFEALYNDGTGQVAASTGGGVPGTWFHLAATISPNQRTVYRNGVFGGTQFSVQSAPLTFSETGIGHIPSDSGEDFDGTIAHVAIYTGSLNNSDVLSLSTGVSPLNYKADNLIHYYPGNCTGNIKDVFRTVGGHAGSQLDLNEVGGTIDTVEEPRPHAGGPIIGRMMVNP